MGIPGDGQQKGFAIGMSPHGDYPRGLRQRRYPMRFPKCGIQRGVPPGGSHCVGPQVCPQSGVLEGGFQKG